MANVLAQRYGAVVRTNFVIPLICVCRLALQSVTVLVVMASRIDILILILTAHFCFLLFKFFKSTMWIQVSTVRQPF